jgi:hypothetical protein
MPSSPFFSGYFRDRVLIFVQASLAYDLPILHFLSAIAGMTGACHFLDCLY